MAIKLSEDQQEKLKHMVEFAEVFACQMHEIMKNHGLADIDGCRLYITVDPSSKYLTEHILFGKTGSDAGVINLGKGKNDAKFAPFGSNSAEYELLFADETVRKAIEARLNREKPLPPDGLWISVYSDNDPVDGWEWDVNDSLS